MFLIGGQLTDSEEYIWYPTSEKHGDEYVFGSCALGVNDISILEQEEFGGISPDFDKQPEEYGDPSTRYPPSVNCNAPKEAFEQDFPSTDLENGWYSFSRSSSKYSKFYYENRCLLLGGGSIAISKSVLVVDHRMIKFDEWEPKESFHLPRLHMRENFLVEPMCDSIDILQIWIFLEGSSMQSM